MDSLNGYLFGPTAGLLVYLIYLYVKRIQYRKKYRLPTGPEGDFFSDKGQNNKADTPVPAYLYLTELRKTYGDIFTIDVAGRKVVVVSSDELFREILVKKSVEFAGRNDPKRIKISFYNNESSFTADDSPRFRLMKKATMTTLKMYGEGLGRLEQVSQGIIANMCRSFLTDGERGTRPLNPKYILGRATGKVITSLVNEEPFTNEQLDAMAHEFESFQVYSSPVGNCMELERWPWLVHLPLPRYNHLKKHRELLWKRSKSVLDNRRKICDTSNPKCIVDGLFRHQEQHKDSSGKPILRDVDVQIIIRDLINAGSITTSWSLRTLVAVLVNHPHVQRALQEEVDHVMGDDLPRIKYRQHMPYTDAVILELMRYMTTTPLLVPHSTTTEVELAGYYLPKGTGVWLNSWSLHHDERYWDEPWKFKPERFLEEDGSVVSPTHPSRARLYAFGAGRRVCVGELLARIRMFLFVTGMMQSLEFLPAEGSGKPRDDPRDFMPGLTIRPQDYVVTVKSRKK